MLSDTVYLWLIRYEQAQDTVFMNEFAQFLQKTDKKIFNLVLYSNYEQSVEEIYFQAKRISGFLSENLIANSVFHLHQWGLVSRTEENYALNTDKFSKIMALSSALVLTNVWNENLPDLSEILVVLRDVPVQKAFVFANNPHLNIHTQSAPEVDLFPNETETAQLLVKMSSFVETWVSHLNHLSKVI